MIDSKSCPKFGLSGNNWAGFGFSLEIPGDPWFGEALCRFLLLNDGRIAFRFLGVSDSSSIMSDSEVLMEDDRL